MLINLGWILVILFVISFLSDDNRILYVVSITYSSIFAFYFSLYSWFSNDSIIQSSLSLLISLYCIYLIYIVVKYNFYPKQLFKMSAVAGLFLLCIYSVDILNELLVSSVANETNNILNILGLDYSVIYDEGYYIEYNSNLRSQIVLACTGIGSISIFVGLLSAIDSIDHKERVYLILLVSGGIYILNMIRNVFISVSYGEQLFHFYPYIIEGIFGKGGHWVSYYIADKIISQLFAVVFLICLIVFIFNITSDDSRLEKEIIYIINRTLNTIGNVL